MKLTSRALWFVIGFLLAALSTRCHAHPPEDHSWSVQVNDIIYYGCTQPGVSGEVFETQGCVSHVDASTKVLHESDHEMSVYVIGQLGQLWVHFTSGCFYEGQFGDMSYVFCDHVFVNSFEVGQ